MLELGERRARRTSREARPTGSGGYGYFTGFVPGGVVARASYRPVSQKNCGNALRQHRALAPNYVRGRARMPAVHQTGQRAPESGSDLERQGVQASSFGDLFGMSVHCLLLLCVVAQSSLKDFMSLAMASREAALLQRLNQERLFVERFLRASNVLGAGTRSLHELSVSFEMMQMVAWIDRFGTTLGREAREALGRCMLEIYAPIARRLNLFSVVEEIESTVLRLLDPVGFSWVEDMLEIPRATGEAVLEKVSESLAQSVQAFPATVRVSHRVKTASSVYLKMKAKKKTLSDIRDVFAIRVIIGGDEGEDSDNLDLCYKVLRHLRRAFVVDETVTKDYIAEPKENGYRGLHAGVMMLHSMPIEVQIRTAKMHGQAESGTASHWNYKANMAVQATREIFAH